jgi:hypothetical protein
MSDTPPTSAQLLQAAGAAIDAAILAGRTTTTGELLKLSALVQRLADSGQATTELVGDVIRVLHDLEARIAALEPTPPPPPPPPPKPGPSGLRMPTSAGPEWRTIIAEDFNDPAPRGTFPGPYARPIPGQREYGIRAYPRGYTDTSGRGEYDEANISAGDSVLVCHLEAPPSGPFKVAAPVPLLANPGTGRWGYVTAAIIEFAWRADVIGWAKTVPLLWPSSQDNRADGELNNPEANLDGTARIGTFVHKAGAPPKPAPVEQWSAQTTTIASDGKWHVSRTEWEAGKVARFYLDGLKVAEWTERIPASPMRFVLQNETRTAGILDRGPAGRVEYDWVFAAVRP